MVLDNGGGLFGGYAIAVWCACLLIKHMSEQDSRLYIVWCVWCPVPTRDLWAGFPQDYLNLAHQWYCSLGQCCDTGDCRITNNITGMERDRDSLPYLGRRHNILEDILSMNNTSAETISESTE